MRQGNMYNNYLEIRKLISVDKRYFSSTRSITLCTEVHLLIKISYYKQQYFIPFSMISFALKIQTSENLKRIRLINWLQ